MRSAWSPARSMSFETLLDVLAKLLARLADRLRHRLHVDARGGSLAATGTPSTVLRRLRPLRSDAAGDSRCGRADGDGRALRLGRDLLDASRRRRCRSGSCRLAASDVGAARGRGRLAELALALPSGLRFARSGRATSRCSSPERDCAAAARRRGGLLRARALGRLLRGGRGGFVVREPLVPLRARGLDARVELLRSSPALLVLPGFDAVAVRAETLSARCHPLPPTALAATSTRNRPHSQSACAYRHRSLGRRRSLTATRPERASAMADTPTATPSSSSSSTRRTRRRSSSRPSLQAHVEVDHRAPTTPSGSRPT